jgi:hypothetical protein
MRPATICGDYSIRPLKKMWKSGMVAGASIYGATRKKDIRSMRQQEIVLLIVGTLTVPCYRGLQ